MQQIILKSSEEYCKHAWFKVIKDNNIFTVETYLPFNAPFKKSLHEFIGEKEELNYGPLTPNIFNYAAVLSHGHNIMDFFPEEEERSDVVNSFFNRTDFTYSSTKSMEEQTDTVKSFLKKWLESNDLTYKEDTEKKSTIITPQRAITLVYFQICKTKYPQPNKKFTNLFSNR